MKKPTIAIVIIAWPNRPDRIDYLGKSIASMRKYLMFPRHTPEYFVHSETQGVGPGLSVKLQELCHFYGVSLQWRHKPASLGGNMNDALDRAREICDPDFLLLTQDDWEFLHPTDVSEDADFLSIAKSFAMVRYATFYTQFVGRCWHKVTTQPRGVLMDVDMSQPYQYGDQPHLRRKSWEQEFGRYIESEFGDYTSPEAQMADTLRDRKWKIAAYEINAVDHCGTLSTCPIRANAMGRSVPG